MVEIRIYIEGGGDSDSTKGRMKEGFNAFFQPLIKIARDNKIRWSVIVCGGRTSAFDKFSLAVSEHPDAFCVLLVDSEEAVKTTPWKHLKTRDGWDCPNGVSDEHCFLMIQSMETWIVADRKLLAKFYGNGYKEDAFPKWQNLEVVEKDTLMDALKKATRGAKTKGEYHKTQHGFELLKKVDVDTLREKCPSCDKLFSSLSERLKAG